MATASFEGVFAVEIIGKEAGNGSEEKGAEASFGGVGRFEPLFFQEVGKKTLSKIVGVGERVAPPQNEGVNGGPIGLAQPFKGLVRQVVEIVRGAEDQRPVRGAKPRRIGQLVPRF